MLSTNSRNVHEIYIKSRYSIYQLKNRKSLISVLLYHYLALRYLFMKPLIGIFTFPVHACDKPLCIKYTDFEFAVQMFDIRFAIVLLFSKTCVS